MEEKTNADCFDGQSESAKTADVRAALQNTEDCAAESSALSGAAPVGQNPSGDEKAAGGGKNFKNTLKKYFSATRIAYLALFTALSYVLYMPFLEFWIIPAVDFLKIDFSNVFVMIAGFSLGPVAAVVVGVLKEILHALTFSSTVGVGELANIIVMLPYILVPSIVYKRHKGIKTVLITLAIGCVGQTLLSFPVNCFLNFPFYLGFNWSAGMNFFLSVWYWVMLFNFVKTVLISVVVLVLYKSVSRLIKLTSEKFSRKKSAEGKKTE